jgi:MFS family permease
MADKRERWFYSYLPTNMAGGCFDSLLPIFVVLALSGSVADISMISVATSAASVPALIFWGAATDAFRWRKHFLVAGFIGRSVAYIVMGMSVGIPQLLFANILMGLLSASSAPAMTILIFESFSRDKWSEKTGKFNNVAGIGNLAGIAFGAAWLALLPPVLGIVPALRMLFVLNAVLALAGAWLAFILVVEPEVKLSREPFHEHAMQLVRWSAERARYLPGKLYRWFHPSHLGEVMRHHRDADGYFGGFLVSSFLYTVGAVSFFTIAPVFLLQKVGVSGTMVFVLNFMQALASTLLFTRIGQMLDRVDKPRALFLAKASRVGLFASYAAAVAISIWSPWVALAFLVATHLALGVAWAVIGDTQMPIAVASATEDRKGAYAGTFNAVVGLGAIAGGAFGGIVSMAVGFELSIIASALLVGASALILYLTVPYHGQASARPA